jgi:hypothetical protein
MAQQLFELGKGLPNKKMPNALAAKFKVAAYLG